MDEAGSSISGEMMREIEETPTDDQATQDHPQLTLDSPWLMIIKAFQESREISTAISAKVEDALMKRVIPAMVQAIHLEFDHKLRASILITVEEAMKNMGHNSSSISLPYQVKSSPLKSLKLAFIGTLPDTLLTFNNIQDEGASLRVELQTISGLRVEIGPEASVKIRICVLDGDFEVEDTDDWTHDDFDKNVAQPRKDRGPLLKGKSEIYLNKGLASVTDVAFTDNSKCMRNGKFRFGARAIKGFPPGVEIRAAVSGAFKVKERRVKSYRKQIPSLENGTDSLKYIGKTLCKKLSDKHIHTVKDFLQLYHTHPDKLKNILQVADNKWAELIKNAKSCSLIEEYHPYYDRESGVHLVLDCVFNVVKVALKDETIQPYKDLTDSQKTLVSKVRLTAYEKRKQLRKTQIPTIPESIQAGPESNSFDGSSGRGLLSLMPPEPGMPLSQSRDSSSQHQSFITSPSRSSVEPADEDAVMNAQSQLGSMNDAIDVLHGENVADENHVKSKRQKLG